VITLLACAEWKWVRLFLGGGERGKLGGGEEAMEFVSGKEVSSKKQRGNGVYMILLLIKSFCEIGTCGRSRPSTFQLLHTSIM
jgi:hypothetical protein